jgi:hypothetical protein
LGQNILPPSVLFPQRRLLLLLVWWFRGRAANFSTKTPSMTCCRTVMAKLVLPIVWAFLLLSAYHQQPSILVTGHIPTPAEQALLDWQSDLEPAVPAPATTSAATAAATTTTTSGILISSCDGTNVTDCAERCSGVHGTDRYLADKCCLHVGKSASILAFEEDDQWVPRLQEFNDCTGATVRLTYLPEGEDGMEDAIRRDVGDDTYPGEGIFDAYIVQAPW